MPQAINLALKTIMQKKQAIVFVSSRASAQKCALEIAKKIKQINLILPEQILDVSPTPTKQCKNLAICLKKEIAFHHAGLLQKQKEIIENEFRAGRIKVICATPTLAAGLSLPVFRVILRSLKRFSGNWGMNYIPVLEYLQMAGRAGRPEYEKFGEAISIAKDDAQKQEIHEKYICGKPEEIYSKLAVEPVLRTYILSLISSGIIRNNKTMLEFFSKTFWAHQFKDIPKLQSKLNEMLEKLQEWDFVHVVDNLNQETKESTNLEIKKEENKVTNNLKSNIKTNITSKFSDFVNATKLTKKQNKTKLNNNNHNEDKIFKATTMGKRISGLYLDPLTANHLITCLNKYQKQNNNQDLDSQTNNFQLLQMISNTLEIRPQLKVRTNDHELVQDAILKHHNILLQKEPDQYDLEYPQFLNSIKTTLFFQDWIDEKTQDNLFEKFKIAPGEINVKISIADWLFYACEEISHILKQKETIKDIRKLRIRIKNGVKEELLGLLKLSGVGRIRARKLHKNNIKNINDLKKTNQTAIGQIIGNKLAQDIKKQLGQEIIEIKPTKRKGQMSLSKFT